MWWTALTAMLLALVVPVLAVRVPPLPDYPNHLARCFFLAFGAGDPVLGRMLVARWTIIPNLAMDLLLPPMMHVMPPLVAGRVVVALALLLPATGAIALHRACFLRRSWWPLGVGLVCYNTLFLLGTLNFQLSAGVALWGGACWVTLRRRRAVWALPTGAGFALLCFVFHLFGFGLFAALVIGAEAAALSSWRNWPDLWQRGAALVGVVIGPMVLLAVSPLAGTAGGARWPSLGRKLGMLLVPFMGHVPWAGLLEAVGLALLMATWMWRGRLMMAPMLRVAGPLLLGAFMAMPTAYKGGYWIDARVPVLGGFVLFALIDMKPLAQREAAIVAVALAGAFLWRMAFVTAFWRGEQPMITGVREVLVQVTPGSRVLVVDGQPHPRRWDGWAAAPHGVASHGFGVDYLHYGAFALIDRKAFWSDMFTLDGQQPLVPRAAYLSAGDGGADPFPPLRALAPSAASAQSSDRHLWMNGWPAKFQFLLVINPAPGIDLATELPRYLQLLDRRKMAELYRIPPAVTWSSGSRDLGFGVR